MAKAKDKGDKAKGKGDKAKAEKGTDTTDVAADATGARVAPVKPGLLDRLTMFVLVAFCVSEFVAHL